MQTRAILIENFPCVINQRELITKFSHCGNISVTEEFLTHPKALTYHLEIDQRRLHIEKTQFICYYLAQKQ